MDDNMIGAFTTEIKEFNETESGMYFYFTDNLIFIECKDWGISAKQWLIVKQVLANDEKKSVLLIIDKHLASIIQPLIVEHLQRMTTIYNNAVQAAMDKVMEEITIYNQEKKGEYMAKLKQLRDKMQGNK